MYKRVYTHRVNNNSRFKLFCFIFFLHLKQVGQPNLQLKISYLYIIIFYHNNNNLNFKLVTEIDILCITHNICVDYFVNNVHLN